MTTHKTKIPPDDFQAILDGRDTYTLPANETRLLTKGDYLVLREYVPAPDGFSTDYATVVQSPYGYTGRKCWALVTDEPIRDGAGVTLPILAFAQDPSVEATLDRVAQHPVPGSVSSELKRILRESGFIE